MRTVALRALRAAFTAALALALGRGAAALLLGRFAAAVVRVGWLVLARVVGRGGGGGGGGGGSGSGSGSGSSAAPFPVLVMGRRTRVVRLFDLNKQPDVCLH